MTNAANVYVAYIAYSIPLLMLGKCGEESFDERREIVIEIASQQISSGLRFKAERDSLHIIFVDLGNSDAQKKELSFQISSETEITRKSDGVTLAEMKSVDWLATYGFSVGFLGNCLKSEMVFPSRIVLTEGEEYSIVFFGDMEGVKGFLYFPPDIK